MNKIFYVVLTASLLGISSMHACNGSGLEQSDSEAELASRRGKNTGSAGQSTLPSSFSNIEYIPPPSSFAPHKYPSGSSVMHDSSGDPGDEHREQASSKKVMPPVMWDGTEVITVDPTQGHSKAVLPATNAEAMKRDSSDAAKKRRDEDRLKRAHL